MTALRQRMTKDLQLRGLAPRAQEAYPRGGAVGAVLLEVAEGDDQRGGLAAILSVLVHPTLLAARLTRGLLQGTLLRFLQRQPAYDGAASAAVAG